MNVIYCILLYDLIYEVFRLYRRDEFVVDSSVSLPSFNIIELLVQHPSHWKIVVFIRLGRPFWLRLWMLPF